MTSLPSRVRVPPSALLVTAVPALAAVLAAALAGWLLVLGRGGILWWPSVPAIGATTWGAVRGMAWAVVVAARDARTGRHRRAGR